MVDEMFDRDYQSRRQELNAGIDAGVASFVAAMRNGFEVLNRIQFDAPWAAPVKGGSAATIAPELPNN